MTNKKVTFDVSDEAMSPPSKAVKRGTPMKNKKARSRIQKHIQMTLQRVKGSSDYRALN